jgi:hypothetical protein
MRRTIDELALDDWLDALQSELRKQAASGAEGRAALERLLDS